MLSRPILAASALLLMLSPAFADALEENGKIVAKQMMSCIDLPLGAPDDFQLIANVQLENGPAIFVSIGFPTMPLTDWEKGAGPLFADAITNCEPYGNISGRAMLLINRKLIESGGEWQGLTRPMGI